MLTIGETLRYLTDRCDGAQSKDLAGLNKPDSMRLHRLALIPEEDWTTKQKYDAYCRLKKYKKQLAGGGIDYEKIPAPLEPIATSDRKISGGESAFRVYFPYDAGVVLAVKNLPGRQFLRVPKDHWAIPTSKTALQPLENFAEEHDFYFDQSAYDLVERTERKEETEVKPEAPRVNPKKIIQGPRGTYIVHFPYDPAIVAEVKTIPGARFSGGDKTWTVPADKARALFDFGLRAGFDLGPLAGLDEEEKRRVEEENQRKALVMAALDLDIMPDGKPLFEHQRTAARQMAERGRLILGDDLGLGKTRSALVAAKAYFDALQIPIWVVAPPTLRENWFREAEAVGVPVEVHSWGKLPLPLESSEYVLLIDEAHRSQGASKTIRGRAFLDLTLHKNCVACFPITGTPMRHGRPINAMPLLQAIKHKIVDNKRDYQIKFCNARATRFSKWDTTGSSHLKEWYEQTKDAILRRTKESCLDLPERMRIMRKAEIGPEARAIYDAKFNQMRESYLRRLRAGQERLAKGEELQEGEISPGGEALVLLNNLRYAGSLAKVECATDLAGEVLEQGHQVVLFTAFLESAKAIHEKLDGEILTGEINTKDRQAPVDRFQSGKSKVFVGTIGAGGEGITLTAASTIILVDRTWSFEEVDQVESRLHRISQKNTVTAIWLQCNGVDEKIDRMIQAKHINTSLALTGQATELEFNLHNEALNIVRELFQ